MQTRKALTLTIMLALLGAGSSFAKDASYVTFGGVYGYNYTWESHGGVDISCNFPVIKYFELGGSLEYLSPKVVDATAVLRPQYPLGKGKFFIDAMFQYRGFFHYKTNEYVFAGAAGYKRPYFKVMLGAFGRTMQDCGTHGDFVAETVNLMYHASFTVRPESSRWNVGGAVANFNLYEFERMWYPMFFINGHYDFDGHFGIIAEVQYKPAGMFHLTNQFYGITVRVGAKLSF